MDTKRQTILVIVSIAAILLAAGCVAFGDEEGRQGDTDTVVMAYSSWGTAMSSTNVMKLVLEEAGYNVETVMVDIGVIFLGLSTGEVDCFVDAWLPSCHSEYMKAYGDKIDIVRYNMEGTRIGMVVPAYVTIDSIEELGEHQERFGGEIITIEPGSGTIRMTEAAIEEYNLPYKAVAGSEVAMLAALKRAIGNDEWVVITGWTPHWKFSRWDLKYLDDPKLMYGEEEYIATLARMGLAEDMPEVYAILERFHWDPDDMNSVMYDIEHGMSPEDAAAAWVNANPDKVNEWLGRA
ncbi:MAG: glycine betaine ABC transporter substrate-binding protein [Methanomicrobiaceae archaeon]|uniref:Glycine betaine abc transport system, glycine betaine-binding protein opuac n=1 Tax=hydrocarbon metagenome TaxID=938273 RepID=A0A0W8FHE7_9ZZZZ|nr:glycine betaine ABC transporter substrate-binding protein [Methanomicrobiaceae archaeon]MDD5419451.1 glycine betaine ABC transporter substrate-binding protein [Methanomicrobiaceae archaeon]